MEIDKRFVFSGHAIGAAAHFHRLDDLDKLDHVIPTLGSGAIPPVGGRSHHKVTNQVFVVEQPRKRTLLSADHAEATAHGRQIDDNHYATEIHALVRGLSILEKFHLALAEFRQKSTYDVETRQSNILTSECKLEGLRLGNVTVKVELDEEPFAVCGTRQVLREHYAKQSDAYRREHGWRFHTQAGENSVADYNGRYFGTLVKKIELDGPEDELKNMTVDGYSIKWNGFGRIFLGEVVISDKDRYVTIARLKMGSDAAGLASIAGGQTNSTTVP